MKQRKIKTNGEKNIEIIVVVEENDSKIIQYINKKKRRI
jgi:hypothetical protein